MRPLPLVPGTPDVPSTFSVAEAINSSCEIVGSQRSEAGGKSRSVAVYWDREGRAHDLNRLVLSNPTPGDGLMRLYSAAAVNAHGQIIGQGSSGAFLLTPICPKRVKSHR